jgi:hypothetical protein
MYSSASVGAGVWARTGDDVIQIGDHDCVMWNETGAPRREGMTRSIRRRLQWDELRS